MRLRLSLHASCRAPGADNLQRLRSAGKSGLGFLKLQPEDRKSGLEILDLQSEVAKRGLDILDLLSEVWKSGLEILDLQPEAGEAGWKFWIYSQKFGKAGWKFEDPDCLFWISNRLFENPNRKFKKADRLFWISGCIFAPAARVHSPASRAGRGSRRAERSEDTGRMKHGRAMIAGCRVYLFLLVVLVAFGGIFTTNNLILMCDAGLCVAWLWLMPVRSRSEGQFLAETYAAAIKHDRRVNQTVKQKERTPIK